MNDIKFAIEARDKDNKLVYGSTLLDTNGVDSVLAIVDEQFDDDTRFQLQAQVDGKVVYQSENFKREDLDKYLDESELAVEKVIQ